MPPEEVIDRGDDFKPPEDLTKLAEGEKKVDVALKEEPEVKKEVEPEKKPEKKGDENLIPRDRFNEAVQKERAKAELAIRRAAELEEQLNTRKVSEDNVEAQKQVKELVKSRNQMLADGDLEKAGEIDTKIFDLQDAMADHKAEVRIVQAKEAAKEEIRYDTAISKLEVEHPELDPDNDLYDQEVVNEVRALMRGYQAEMNLSPSAAITRAAARIFKQAEKVGLREESSAAAEKAATDRKAESVEKNIDAAKKQPASSKDVGLDHDKRGGGLDAKTVMKMNYKEFSELDEAVLSRMRGDSL